MNQTRETPMKSQQGKYDPKIEHKPATPEQRLDEDYDVKPSIPKPQPNPGAHRKNNRNS